MIARITPIAPIARIGGAAGLLVGGYVHWCLYRHGYRSIPVIGVLFAANVAVSVAAAIVVALVRRVVAAVAGVAVALGTLGAFVASRLPGGIFHFQERGWQPRPQSAIAVSAETFVIVMMVGAAWNARRTHVVAAASK